MIDISNHEVGLNCPSCNRAFTVKLKQVANEETVLCTCGQQIELIDNNHSSRKAIHDLNDSFEELEIILKDLGK